MSFLLLLLLLPLCLYSIASSAELVMHKVRVINSPENRVSVKMHSYSPDMTPLHASLQFYGNQSSYHGALIIDRLNMMKYRRVASTHSPMPLGNHIEVVTRSGRHTFSYHLVQSMYDNAYTTSSSLDTSAIELLEMTGVIGPSAAGAVAYDAILMLSQYSSVWHRYNTARFTRHSLTLSYEPGGTLSEATGAFSAVVRMPCAQNPTAGPCVVQSALRIDDQATPFSLLLDFNSPFNYLPPDLYERWEQNPRLTLQLDNNDTLPLTRVFAFVMHDSPTVVLGADAVHRFSQLSYSTEQNAVHVWYYFTIQAAFSNYEAVSVILVILDVVTLICLFAWCTSYNYFVLDYIVHFYNVARRWHYFAYKQVFLELAVMTVALLNWILVGAFSLNTPPSTEQDARTILLIVFSLSQFILLLLILTVWRDPTRRAFNWYTPRLYFAFARDPPPGQGKPRDLLKMVREKRTYRTLEDKQRSEANRTLFYDVSSRGQQRRLYDQVVKNYHDQVCKPPTAVTIARNLVFATLLFLNMLLVFNFFSENSIPDQTLLVLLSFGMTYYTVRFIVVGILYMQRLEAPYRANHAWFVALLVLECVLLVVYTALAYKYAYIPYMNAINTGYEPIVLTTITVVALLLVVAFAVAIATGKVGDYIDRFIELLERRVELRGGENLVVVAQQ